MGICAPEYLRTVGEGAPREQRGAAAQLGNVPKRELRAEHATNAVGILVVAYMKKRHAYISMASARQSTLAPAHGADPSVAAASADGDTSSTTLEWRRESASAAAGSARQSTRKTPPAASAARNCVPVAGCARRLLSGAAKGMGYAVGCARAERGGERPRSGDGEGEWEGDEGGSRSQTMSIASSETVAT